MFTSFIQSFRPGNRPMYQAPAALRNDINNLKVWFDPNDETSVSLNQGNVVSIDGQSFTSIHPANSTGGNRPAYVTNGLNDKNTVQFNGTSSYLTINPFTDFDGISGYTFFFLCKYDRTTNQRFVETNAPGASDLGFGINATGNFEYHMGGGTVNSGIAADTNWHLHSYTFDSTQAEGSRVNAWYDNQKLTGFTETTVVGPSVLSGTSVIYIGSSEAQTLHSQGQMAEIVFFIRPLSIAEMESVNVYLMKKWGIY